MAREPGELVVIGGGPVAGAALLALAGGGAGPFVLVDGGHLGADEAPRHPLLHPEDVGAPRAEATRRRLAALHPTVRIEPRLELPPLAGAAAVLACPDEVALALAAQEAALGAGVPLVHAAWSAGTGHLLTVQPGVTACLGCLYEGVTAADAATPDGLPFALAWVLGALAAAELHRLAAGETGFHAGRLLALDATGASRAIPVRRRAGCPRCAGASRADALSAPPECP